MRYYKQIEDGLILAIGTGPGNMEISEREYNEIMAVIQAKPEAGEGFAYLLKEDLTWEMIEVPIIEPSNNEEITIEEATAIILGGDSV